MRFSRARERLSTSSGTTPWFARALATFAALLVLLCSSRAHAASAWPATLPDTIERLSTGDGDERGIVRGERHEIEYAKSPSPVGIEPTRSSRGGAAAPFELLWSVNKTLVPSARYFVRPQRYTAPRLATSSSRTCSLLMVFLN